MNTDPRSFRRLLPVLYEDDDLIAVAKPAGVDTGHLANAADGIAEIVAVLRGLTTPWEPANRLSRYESGVLLLGKNAAMVRHLRQGLRTLRIDQEFVAVVLGRMAKPRLSVALGHGSSKGRGQKKRTGPKKTGTATMSVVSPATTLTALQHGPKRTLVSCQTNVATTHSLRAQLRSLRLRVLGDVTQNETGRPMSPEMTCLHLSRISFHHPVLKRKVSIQSRAPDSFRTTVNGDRDLFRPLQAALVRRLPCLVDPSVEAYRVLTGDAEDVPGLVVERFGPILLMQLLEERETLTDLLPEFARWYRDVLEVPSVCLKRNVRRTPGRASASTESSHETPTGTELIFGKSAPEEITVREGRLRFLIRPHERQSVGLFLDHRENRQRVVEMAEGKDALNLFAYTCGFSLAAAVGGANSTVSVDLSSKHLEWGKLNFELNELPTDGHEFIQSDAFRFLEKTAQGRRAFDMIVIDPPSFAHGRRKGQDFSIARDLGNLVQAALRVLRPEGVMMISTNLRRMSNTALKDRIKQGAHGRRHRFVSAPALPIDFAVDPDHAKTVFVQFE